MPANSPETELMEVINTAVGSLTKATNLFDSPPIAAKKANIPEQCVFVFETGGAAPLPYLNNNADANMRDVQIRTRSPDFGPGVTLAREARDAAHRSAPTGFFGVLARESAPVYLGKDDQDLHEWSNNITLFSKE